MNGGIFLALLAAGKANRFGGEKLDVSVDGRPLGRIALDALRSLDLGIPTIVTGEVIPAFAKAAQDSGEAMLSVNARADSGIGTSVALAAERAEHKGCPALLLALADMPALRPDTLRALIAGVAPGRPAAVRYPGGAGIPACFPADFYPRLKELGNDRGASAILRQGKTTRLIDTPYAELRDIDTKEDLAAFRDETPLP